MNEKRTTDDLRAVGFQQIATWQSIGQGIGLKTDEARQDEILALLTASNALYSFCVGDEVRYIGKTARSLKRRLYGYCKPGPTQSTNLRCNKAIRDALARGETIDVLALVPITELQFAGFEINLAAGLEDALIRRFDPPWNGGGKGKAMTETAQTEAEQEGAAALGPTLPETGEFAITLGPTYYEKGVVNPGVKASALLGEEGRTLVVQFSDGTPSVATRIDRRANANGSVRFLGGNGAIADWFQANFKPGEVVRACVHGPYAVELMAPDARVPR